MGGGARNYWTQIAIQDREVRVIRMSDLRLALGIIAVLVVATLQEARPEDEGSSVNIAAIQERIHKHIEGRNLEACRSSGAFEHWSPDEDGFFTTRVLTAACGVGVLSLLMYLLVRRYEREGERG